MPFSSLRPIFRARTVPDAPPFDPSIVVSLQACLCLFLLSSDLEISHWLLMMNKISLQLMFSKFEYDGKLNPTFVEGPFELPVSSIRAYIKHPITPRYSLFFFIVFPLHFFTLIYLIFCCTPFCVTFRFVHVSSAGVTRPERPGIDLSKQPPAVRLNKELDYILTFKLKVKIW